MQLYGWSGQRARALRQYERCVALLRAELAALPAPTTTALYHALQQHGHPVPQQSSVVTYAWRSETHRHGARLLF